MNEPIMPQIENWRVISYYQDWILFVTCGETPAGTKNLMFLFYYLLEKQNFISSTKISRYLWWRICCFTYVTKN